MSNWIESVWKTKRRRARINGIPARALALASVAVAKLIISSASNARRALLTRDSAMCFAFAVITLPHNDLKECLAFYHILQTSRFRKNIKNSNLRLLYPSFCTSIMVSFDWNVTEAFDMMSVGTDDIVACLTTGSIRPPAKSKRAVKMMMKNSKLYSYRKQIALRRHSSKSNGMSKRTYWESQRFLVI